MVELAAHQDVPTHFPANSAPFDKHLGSVEKSKRRPKCRGGILYKRRDSRLVFFRRRLCNIPQRVYEDAREANYQL